MAVKSRLMSFCNLVTYLRPGPVIFCIIALISRLLSEINSSINWNLEIFTKKIVNKVELNFGINNANWVFVVFTAIKIPVTSRLVSKTQQTGTINEKKIKRDLPLLNSLS